MEERKYWITEERDGKSNGFFVCDIPSYEDGTKANKFLMTYAVTHFLEVAKPGDKLTIELVGSESVGDNQGDTASFYEKTKR